MQLRDWRIVALSLLCSLALVAVACGPQKTEVPGGEPGAEEAVTEPAVVEDEAASRVPADTFVSVTIGEPESLDPAWTYETTGAGYEANMYDSLIYFAREKPDEFVPALATEWDLSDDGLTYTFTIRDGVTFHEGGTLEPHDIAYSIQRALLQDRVDGPMWLYLEPLLGTSSIESLALETAGLSEEVAEGEESPTLADVPEEVKLAICENVKAAVSADDEAGTVTIVVLQPTPWLLQLLAQAWGSALDQEWMIEQGGWDGTCETWPAFHSPAAEESVLFNAANGTGPYMLGGWKPGQEITLEANEEYWRTEPVWPGGPSGPPALKHILLQKVDEWGTRFTKLSAGEADTVVVPRAEISQVEPMVHTVYTGGDETAPSESVNEDGTLKLFLGYPTVAMTAAMFNFDINADSEFIGSGTLDGFGIPVDFFSDIHVRRGFNYCFDWDTYIEQALQGEGIQARGPIIQGLQGFSEDSDVFTYDLAKCEEELALAWDGALPETGFEMTLAYNEGNDTRKMAAEILAEQVALVNENYQIEVIDLEWPSFLDARRGRRLPISVSGWLEDYHDASNWVHPFMHSNGAYARAQSFPSDMQAEFDALIDKAVLETDEAVRDELYSQLQQMAYEEAINIFLHQATGRFYINQQVTGWFNNPLTPGLWYYAYSK